MTNFPSPTEQAFLELVSQVTNYLQRRLALKGKLQTQFPLTQLPKGLQDTTSCQNIATLMLIQSL